MRELLVRSLSLLTLVAEHHMLNRGCYLNAALLDLVTEETRSLGRSESC